VKKINLNTYSLDDNYTRQVKLAEALNEIMGYLEHMHGRNGKLFTCVSCHHATGYIGDLGKCCNNPLYEVSD